MVGVARGCVYSRRCCSRQLWRCAVDLASIVPLGIFAVSGSALVTYTVAVSRQRVWLKRKKSEELFRTAEETYLDLYDYFRPHYEMRRTSVKPNVSCDIAEVKRHIVDMKTLVGVYFPCNCSPCSVQAVIVSGFRASVRRMASRAPIARRRPVSMTERMSA